MDLYSKDDDDRDEDEDGDDDADSSGTDECEEIAGDIIDAVKSGDKVALAAALKQFSHYEAAEGSDDEKSKHGSGVLIALGSPKKG